MSQLYYRIKEWGSQISVLQVTSSKKKNWWSSKSGKCYTYYLPFWGFTVHMNLFNAHNERTGLTFINSGFPKLIWLWNFSIQYPLTSLNINIHSLVHILGNANLFFNLFSTQIGFLRVEVRKRKGKWDWWI